MSSLSQVSVANYSLSTVDTQASNKLGLLEQAKAGKVEKAQELHDAYTQFVGETFYGQMMKSMRSTLDKPAYFNGGQAEEMFQSQLDQQISQDWAAKTGDQFAEPMFQHQFPKQAAMLREAQEASTDKLPLSDLSYLRRY